MCFGFWCFALGLGFGFAICFRVCSLECSSSFGLEFIVGWVWFLGLGGLIVLWVSVCILDFPVLFCLGDDWGLVVYFGDFGVLD